jgi:hypothetical protein
MIYHRLQWRRTVLMLPRTYSASERSDGALDNLRARQGFLGTSRSVAQPWDADVSNLDAVATAVWLAIYLGRLGVNVACIGSSPWGALGAPVDDRRAFPPRIRVSPILSTVAVCGRRDRWKARGSEAVGRLVPPVREREVDDPSDGLGMPPLFEARLQL